MQTDLSVYIRNLSYLQAQSEPHTDIQRDMVKDTIEGHPEGITDLEICISTGISRSSVNARRNELDGVVAVGFAKITSKEGDRLNTLWGIE